MKTKRVKKLSAGSVVRNYRAGLLYRTQQTEVEKLINKKQINDLSAFFLEESLTDYEFNYHLRTLNY